MSKWLLLSTNLGNPYTVLPSPRHDTRLTPLVDGKLAFAEMERAIVAGINECSSNKTVYIAMWAFDPYTKLQSSEAKQLGITDWGGLLGKAAFHGMDVRVIISSVDGILHRSWHKDAWESYHWLIKKVKKVTSQGGRSNFQVICSQHTRYLTLTTDTLLSHLPRRSWRRSILTIPAIALKHFLIQKTKKSIKDCANWLNDQQDLDDRKFEYTCLPGMWPFISLDKSSKAVINRKPRTYTYGFFPASHHEKICIVNGKIGFCGGLNILNESLDDHHHKPKKQDKSPWHDIHCRVEGSIVQDMTQSFIARWNDEINEFTKYVDRRNQYVDRKKYGIKKRTLTPILPFITPPPAPRPTPPPAAIRPVPPPPAIRPVPPPPARRPVPPPPARLPVMPIQRSNQCVTSKPTHLRPVLAQMQRTVTQKGKAYHIQESYKKILQQAKYYVYIENQYLRDDLIAKCLIERRKENNNLQVIIVVPIAPEEAVENNADEITNYGMYLRYKLLKKLESQFGSNIGIYTMVQKKKAVIKPKLPTEAGSPFIYVHSKVLIVDDQFASIGSANACPRGFRTDTEMNIAWTDPQTVKDFRLQLWNELLGTPKASIKNWTLNSIVSKWNKIAKSNAANKTKPEDRKGFIVPFTYTNEKWRGKDPGFIRGKLMKEFV